MPQVITNSMAKMWEWRIVIFWGFLFSLDSLITAFIGATMNLDVNTCTKFGWLMIFLICIKQWATTMMGFLSKVSNKLAAQNNDTSMLPISTGGTEFFQKKPQQVSSVTPQPTTYSNLNKP